MPTPGEGERSGFVPCQQKGHHFVAQLLVAHATPIFVPRLHKH
jgi:hypothetical protein